MASSPYPLRRGILDVPQQALVLKVLYDATEDGAFRFESVRLCSCCQAIAQDAAPESQLESTQL